MSTQDMEKMVLNQTIYRNAVLNYKLTDPDHRFLVFNVCIDVPPNIVSDGLWGEPIRGALQPSRSTLPLFEMQILTIFMITQCFHLILKRLGIPYFVSQVMAGFVLGPSFKISDSWMEFKHFLFPYGSEDMLSMISLFGYAFFLFLNGVQMDFSMITRTGVKAWTIAFSSLVIPTVLGLIVSYNYMENWQLSLGEFDAKNLPVVVIGHTGCSFAVIASLLSDLEILNSELGRLALSAGLVMDVITTVGSGVGTAIISSIKTDSHDDVQGKGTKLALFSSSVYLAFIILIPLFARPIMRLFVRYTPEGRPVRKIYTYMVVLMALGVGLLGMFSRQSALAGILIVGLVVPEGPPLGSELIKQFELFSTWFLLPLFITSCTMKVDITLHINNKLVITMVGIIIAVHLLKMLITVGICRYCHMPKTDGLCLALMLSCKGVVDFCTNVFMHDAMLLSNEAFAIMTISVLLLGTMSHVAVKLLYDPSRKYAGYQKRNILNLKPNSELRIVSCIHKPSHIIPIKNVLDMCCPTSSNPLVVHVLHLMELVGRSSPIFIAHRLQEKIGSGHHNFSEDIIVTFDLFEQDNAGTASVSSYTAISPLRFMHDDICYLALDKLASIIILPFHVRWADNGSVESEDDNIRSLNSRVLERAPCSVGILVNRGSSSNHTNSKQIAMIFLGGADDREALCLAKRTIKECAYSLVVYHLVSNNEDFTNWDVMLDDELLKGLKGAYGSVENVTYEKVTIENPSETTAFVSDVANHYDFIIAGRRNGVKSPQTAALENWMEYSELGVIGDLLASPDTNTKASILVVQQQLMPKS
ncbi:Sodium/solute symporter superfamily [Sesbania bispinosa]|nr:Sodium/solute symporter superfamily [Sesbania bispinosa]